MGDPNLFTVEVCFQLALAMTLGLVIGFEREHRRKAAGMRTFALVTLGATLFTVLSVEGFTPFATATGVDPSRIASQIVIGMGFIGGGLIVLRGNQIQGLTTAAGLWVAAAVGMAIGVRWYNVAVIATLFMLFIMWVVRLVEEKVPRVPKSLANKAK